MKERQFSVKFIRKIKKDFPYAFIYKIPDCAGMGGMRPFDIIMVYKGCPYAIELKRDSKQHTTPYQEHMLKKFQNACGRVWVITPENCEDLFRHMDYMKKQNEDDKPMTERG
jgi:hypothetical protein